VDTDMAIDLACAYHRSTDVRGMPPRPNIKPVVPNPKPSPRFPVEDPGPTDLQ
ncbi:hypothetical protein NDU88_001815, partial [Pleurodeles waltl]